MSDTQKNFYKKLYGAVGENRAVRYLKKLGFKILDRNYRTRLGEIDIIAADGDAVVFVEVKTRSGDDFGAPSEAVTAAKRRKYELVASEYLTRSGKYEENCRFDVVEVTEKGINHIKDAFFI